MFRKKKLTKLT